MAVGSAMGLAGDAVGLGQGGSVGMRMELAWVRLAWVWFTWAGVGVGEGMAGVGTWGRDGLIGFSPGQSPYVQLGVSVRHVRCLPPPTLPVARALDATQRRARDDVDRGEPERGSQRRVLETVIRHHRNHLMARVVGQKKRGGSEHPCHMHSAAASCQPGHESAAPRGRLPACVRFAGMRLVGPCMMPAARSLLSHGRSLHDRARGQCVARVLVLSWPLPAALAARGEEVSHF